MRKFIGICTTKIDDEFSRSYISLMHSAAEKEGYSLAVFHSIFDFFDKTVETGARAVFDMLPYKALSAVVILRDQLFDSRIIDNIISGAQSHNVPVIMARGEDKRCFSLTGSFEDAYASLIASALKLKGVNDTFYIAGRKNDDPDSAKRVAVYKKTLEEYGGVFMSDRVEYGAYWEVPALRALDRIFDKNGGKAPAAIFCANDIMAFTVIEKLKEMGVRVPEDTAVTGFDGLESSEFCLPPISSCREDTAALTELTLASVKKLSAGESVPEVQYYPFMAAVRQSSGGSAVPEADGLGSRMFSRMRRDEINERRYNEWLDMVISVPSIDNLRRNMPEMAAGDYSVSIRADAFFEADAGAGREMPSEYLMMIRGADGKAQQKFVPASGLMYDYLDHAPEKKAVFFSMISNKDLAYGIAAAPAGNVQNEAQKINRYVRTLNRALYVALCGEKQRRSVGEHYQKKYTDALTGMLNMDGANNWFADAVLNDFTRSNQLSVGVYTFINYQQVLEKYGTYVLEENMQYIANSLKLANPENAVIARTTADSFAVMLLHPSEMQCSDVIDNAISLFYGSLDVKARSKNKNSDIEVSCGYHDTPDPWEGKLSDYLNAATSNLYRNRVSFEKNMPKSLNISDSTQMLEYRAAFMTLLNKDLFTYHFQPIVDARTGGIAAYEALMRTKGSVIMSPLDVLAAATMFSKLEQVEYMSFLNIFRRVAEERDKFVDRCVFINTIPGHFLSAELCDTICRQYGELLANTVIEITESETITLDELEAIRTFGGNKDNIRIAVDDYGTGHSNIVNLMEYKPQIVKVDRYLISNIQSDKNKQMFVKSIIEFSKENNIQVLAEGVETSEELETVIDFGVDYIQGYYTARPSEEILQSLPEEIKTQIAERAAKRNSMQTE